HLPTLPVSVQPACRRLANVPCRVDRTGRNQQFATDLRMVKLAGALKFSVSFQQDNYLVRRVPKPLPGLTRWDCPHVAAETTLGPISSDFSRDLIQPSQYPLGH